MKKKKSHLYAFGTVLLLIFSKKSHFYFEHFLSDKTNVFMNFSRILDQISKQMVYQGFFHLGIPMEHPNVKLLMVLYWMENFPHILLFSPIFLLVFDEISYLYFYSDSSSIQNSRVGMCLNYQAMKWKHIQVHGNKNVSFNPLCAGYA